MPQEREARKFSHKRRRPVKKKGGVIKKVINVLVVDDERMIIDFLSRLLALEGIKVKSAEDAFKAVKLAKR